MKRHLLTIGAGVLAVFMATETFAQNLQDRIQNVQQNQQQQQQQQQRTVQNLLQQSVGEQAISDIDARTALQWVADQSGIPIVASWDQLEFDAAPDRDVTVPPNITVAQAIDLILDQMEELEELIWEPTPHFVRIMTKTQANRRSVVRIYEIGDLLMAAPHFDNAPNFDLSAIDDQGGGRGGGRGGGGGGRGGGGGGGGRGGGGGGQGLFGGQGGQQQDDVGLTREEQAMELMDLIRSTIEPDIWEEFGGMAGSIRHYGQALIIRAPNYVHRQIGLDQAMVTGAAQNRPRPTTRSGQTTEQQLQGTRTRSEQPRGGTFPYRSLHRDVGVR